MRVLLCSRYDRMGASSRVRLFQYLPYLNQTGLDVVIKPLFSDDYLKSRYAGKSIWLEVLKSYFYRVINMFAVFDYDVIWLQTEFFPFLPASVERLLFLVGRPYIVDYDDAYFHRYDCHSSWLVRKFLGKKINVVMRYAAVVVVGNDYLARHARAAGASHVVVVPTVVDLERYSVRSFNKKKTLTIGWIGSPSTFQYLLSLLPVFVKLQAKFDVSFVAVGANENAVLGTPIVARQWSEASEVAQIQSFDIGLMPLSDSDWERGKCGYKLIQYMACGLPVVASPVGVNNQIVTQGENGYLANDLSEWEAYLTELLCNAELRQKLGENGRKKVESTYSLQAQRQRLAEIFHSVSNK